MNSTIEKFGYPVTLIKEFDHWIVLLRPAQVTFGSLVLAAKNHATAYGDLPRASFAEQGLVIAAIEQALQRLTGYRRINYLMLMMIDPHVHLHVIPRYDGSHQWNGRDFPDAGWPGPPKLDTAIKLDDAEIASLRDELIDIFR